MNNVVLDSIFDGFLSFDFDDWFVPEIISSLIVILIIIILSFVIYFKFKGASENPLEEQKGFKLVISMAVEKVENFVVEIMGENNRGFAGVACGLAIYVFLSFIFGLTGLASPMSYLGVCLSLGFTTLIFFFLSAIRYQKWRYFKRYVEPIFIFLPVNIITTFTPGLSLALRLFGNAIGGFCIMGIVYFSLENLSNFIFGSIFMGNYWANSLGVTVSGAEGPAGIFLAPLITPVLHLYFDLFSGFIQTFVYLMLTLIQILQEIPEEPELVIEKVSQNS